jgi:hypothetical protein
MDLLNSLIILTCRYDNLNNLNMAYLKAKCKLWGRNDKELNDR